MGMQIKILTRLELCNLFGWNVLRFSGDGKRKRKEIALRAVWLFVLAFLILYICGLCYGLALLGLEETIPAYLIALSGLTTFLFGMLKAGSVVFRREGYDMLCALPVTKTAVAASRLLRMYVENMLVSVLVILPGIIVYVLRVRPGAMFYPAFLFGIWSVPLIPTAAAVLVGAAVTGVASRMRHKSLATAGLSLLAVLMILYGSSKLSAMEGELVPEMLQELSATVMKGLGKVYPPAVWMGNAMVRGSLTGSLLCAVLSLAVFTAVAVGVGYFFHGICRRLYGDIARHDYRMGRLNAQPLAISLCRREFRRYFASSVYVINTIIGPIMGCVFAGAVLFGGKEALAGILPGLPAADSLIPFVLAGIFCLMNATSVSVSMEGKNLWILKSLPLSAKEILDAKIGMNLLLILPFYLLSELMLLLALKPGIIDLLWLVLIPAAVILFSCVFGITANLHFPVLGWENEVTVVKQSASVLIGGMSGFLLVIAGGVGAWMAPGEYAGCLKAVFCAVILFGAYVLYRRNNRFDICAGL